MAASSRRGYSPPLVAHAFVERLSTSDDAVNVTGVLRSMRECPRGLRATHGPCSLNVSAQTLLSRVAIEEPRLPLFNRLGRRRLRCHGAAFP